MNIISSWNEAKNNAKKIIRQQKKPLKTERL